MGYNLDPFRHNYWRSNMSMLYIHDVCKELCIYPMAELIDWAAISNPKTSETMKITSTLLNYRCYELFPFIAYSNLAISDEGFESRTENYHSTNGFVGAFRVTILNSVLFPDLPVSITTQSPMYGLIILFGNSRIGAVF